MTDVNARIEQFRKMAEADPDNELGHFSLGKALLDAGDATGAEAAFNRTIALNANISKAYQLLASALLKGGKKDEAVKQLTTGIGVADKRGDLLPRNEMMAQLKELGAAVPELRVAPGAKVEVGEGEVLCKRCGRIGPKLPKPPFKNAFGQKIFEQTCAPCWKDAIGQGTKVINELRLPLSDPQAQKVWDQHIAEFLNIEL
jgi:Fe-S cluster biosynthesis and repair protein YggX